MANHEKRAAARDKRMRKSLGAAAQNIVHREFDAIGAQAPPTISATILLTEQAASMIRTLLAGGLYGSTENEVVERLVNEALARRFPSAVRG